MIILTKCRKNGSISSNLWMEIMKDSLDDNSLMKIEDKLNDLKYLKDLYLNMKKNYMEEKEAMKVKVKRRTKNERDF